MERETIRVADGPLASFNGVVKEVDIERQMIEAAVSICGRAPPGNLEFRQVEQV
ncbi:hypothetical protein [Methylobacterium dankookense]|uniref:hypothetical protein n=1 Tax=Methylobacterium dankookense TaxID=560405 RepID=UPI001643962B